MTTIKHRSLIVLSVVVLAAALSAAMLAGGGGSGGGGIGPAAALAQAAEATAGVTSGVATSQITLPGGDTATVVLRFDGDDVEATFDEVLPEGGTRERTIRAVDGAGFEKQPDGSWKALEGDAGTAVAAVRDDIADRALFDAVRGAADVTQEGDVYRARLSPEQLAGIDNALLATGGAPPADGAAVEVEAGADGLIRRIAIDAGTFQRTVTYAELGQPQEIAAP